MTPKQTLRAYGRKEATTDQVMRALFAHDDWYMPAGLILDPGADAEPRVHPHAITVGGPSYPAGDTLWVFTDAEAVHRAAEAGSKMGLYVGGVSGEELAARWDPAQFSLLKVNVCSPREDGWIIGGENHHLAAMWASTLRLERALWTPPAERWAAILGFPGFMLWTTPDRRGLQLISLRDSAGQYAAAFTAPDRAAAVKAQLGPEEAAKFTVAYLSGEQMLRAVLRFEGFAGLALNSASTPHPVLLRAEMQAILGD